MKVAALGKCTGGKICELESRECGAGHIADVSQLVRLGDRVACKGTGSHRPGRVASYSDFDREKAFACFDGGCTASAADIADPRPATVAEQARAVQEGRVLGYRRLDVSCPDRAPGRCRSFCPQFDDREAR